ncbi:MAG TPA: hypothetical protein VF407_08065 [Polyangiaceae bacterium]
MRRLVRRVLVLGTVVVPVVGLTHCERVRVNDSDGGVTGSAGITGECAPYLVEEDAGDDAGPGCNEFYHYPCGLPAGITGRDHCFFSLNDCYALCNKPNLNCSAFGSSCASDGVTVIDDTEAGVTVECTYCVGIAGRRPDGLRAAETIATSDRVGRYFAEMAHLEAASVHAFRIMGHELAALGAPSEILVAIERARKDEVLHTRITAKLARAHGAKPQKACVARAKKRSLEAVAIENAVEGCVRETFAAVLASWQGEHAEDQNVRSAMASIAVDETRHAALSWRVAEWIESRLDRAAKARVDEARLGAIAALEAELEGDIHPTLARAVGLPSVAVQRRLLAELAASLGLAAAA